MPIDERLFSFRPVTSDDLPMLAHWLRRPHFRQWWGEPAEELELIRVMAEGEDSTEPYLISMGGKPIGYVQVWFADHQRDTQLTAKHPWLQQLEKGAVGVDVSLAEEAALSKGIGSAALRAFIERLRLRGHRRIVIDPDRENTRAIRAYEKVGFRPLPGLTGQPGRALIMQLELDGPAI